MHARGKRNYSVEIKNHGFGIIPHSRTSAGRIDKHYRTSRVPDDYPGCTILVLRPVPVPCHDHQIHVAFMSDLRQLRSRLASSDFEFEMHAGTECAASDNTIHKFLSPGRPFMVRL